MLLSDAFVFRRFDQFFSADDFIQPFERVIYIWGGWRILFLSLQDTDSSTDSVISGRKMYLPIICWSWYFPQN